MQRKLLKILFEDVGFTVTAVEDGEAALLEARRIIPSALISDVLMPRLDGFRPCLALRQDPELKRIPVVLVSAACAEEADRRLARAVGANELLFWTSDYRGIVPTVIAAIDKAPPPASEFAAEIAQEYTHRLIRQLERQAHLNATLSHRVAVQEAEIAILASLTQTLPTVPGVDELLQVALYRCLDAAGVSKGLAYVSQPDGRLVLKTRLGYPDDAADRAAAFFGQDEWLRQTMANGEVVRIPLSAAPQEREARILAAAGAKALLIVPLLLGPERLGAIVIASEKRSLDEDWGQFATAVGAQIGQALGLARVVGSLNDHREKLARILETMTDGLLLSDLYGRFTLVNRAAEIFFGLSAEALMQWTAEGPLWKAVTSRSTPLSAEPHTRVLKTGESVSNEELGVERSDGTRLVLLVNCAALRNDAGAVIGTVTSLTDITAQKSNEETLQRQAKELSQYNAELREFACVAAHDLQEPLRSITNFSQRLLHRNIEAAWMRTQTSTSI